MHTAALGLCLCGRGAQGGKEEETMDAMTPLPLPGLRRFYTVNASCTEGDMAEYGALLKKVVASFKPGQA